MSENLTSKQARALASLLAGSTVEEAAASARVNPTTVYRWLQQEAFRQQYQRARRQVVERAASSIQQAATKAVQVMTTIMLDKNAAPSVRLRAAQGIYEQATKWVEVEEFTERLEALEATMRGRK
jgi:dihydroneopterin aldolase